MAETQMERCPRCPFCDSPNPLSRRLMKLGRKGYMACTHDWHSTPAAPETPPEFKNCAECDDAESCWLAEMCWKKLGTHPMAETPRKEEA